jgi:hypothetical protein
MATASTVIVLSYAAMQASNDASRIRDVQRAFAATVPRVAEIGDVDTALVAVHPNQFDPAGNFGVRFGRYARALNLEWPAIRDIRCGDIPSPVPTRYIVVVVSEMCASPSHKTANIALVRQRFHWPDPRSRTDTISVTILEAPSK